MFVILSTLTCSDVPWLITFSLLKILKLLARLGLEIGFGIGIGFGFGKPKPSLVLVFISNRPILGIGIGFGTTI